MARKGFEESFPKRNRSIAQPVCDLQCHRVLHALLLVLLYLTVLHPLLIRASRVNNLFAVWLPAGASAFNVVLVTRFFDNLPREVFEAAKVDGAGAFRLFGSNVLPMSEPILGVVSVFTFMATWKDCVWPMPVSPCGPAAGAEEARPDSLKRVRVPAPPSARAHRATAQPGRAPACLRAKQVGPGGRFEE